MREDQKWAAWKALQGAARTDSALHPKKVTDSGEKMCYWMSRVKYPSNPLYNLSCQQIFGNLIQPHNRIRRHFLKTWKRTYLDLLSQLSSHLPHLHLCLFSPNKEGSFTCLIYFLPASFEYPLLTKYKEKGQSFIFENKYGKVVGMIISKYEMRDTSRAFIFMIWFLGFILQLFKPGSVCTHILPFFSCCIELVCNHNKSRKIIIWRCSFRLTLHQCCPLRRYH